MTTNEQKTLNPADTPKQTVEKTDAVSINKISGKEIFITEYSHTRGRPTDFTQPEDIGEDGQTDFWTIKVDTPFDLEHKKEVKPISTFFIKKAQANYIERIPSYSETLEKGGRIGPVKPVKKVNPKTNRQYWTFLDERDEDYKE